MTGPEHPEHWPPRHLALTTPRLELRPDDDAGLFALAELAYAGVHPPERMPFSTPWTDADPRYLGRGILQHFWAQRAELSPQRWSLHFLVRRDGQVLGVQSLSAVDFAVTRQVLTGSWLGMAHQGRGLGTEMRAAVLAFAFDHLGAVRARSTAFVDNPASHRASQRLGYRRDGGDTVARRGEPAELVRLVLDRAEFRRPDWTLRTAGVAGCLALLGAGWTGPISRG